MASSRGGQLLLLDDGDGAAQHAQRLGHVRVRREEVRVLLVANLSRRLQVSLVGARRRGELPDLRLEGGNLRRRVLHRRGEPLRVALPSLDGELELLRRVTAVIRELLVDLLLRLAVLDDLGLEVPEQLDNLLDRRDRGRRDTAEEREALHCSAFGKSLERKSGSL